jgi:proteasome lid subunit RPN8/RPN11
MREDEYSHKGVDRATQIDKKLIESNEYRRKFDNATDNPKVNKTLYDSAKEMLIERSGTRYESMRWIDGDTGEIIAKAEYMGKSDKYSGSEFEEKVLYDDAKLSKQLNNHVNILTLHNHPNSTAPSSSDLNSMVIRHYRLGFVVTHDGRLYKYSANDTISSTVFDMVVSDFLDDGYSINEAQLLAYENFAKNSDISVMEVTK